MRTFVAYSYHPRDKWIEEMIFPIIQAFGDEVDHGKLMPGEPLPEAVKEKIRKSDAVLAFNTRRIDPATGQPGQTSQVWVLQELGIALGLNVPRFEIREKDGNPQQGIGAGIQHLEYDPAQRDLFLVEFVKNYGELRHRTSRFDLHLMPDEFTDAVAPFLSDGNLRVTYQLMDSDTYEEEEPVKTRIITTTGGLFIRTGGISGNNFIRIHVECGANFRWTSKFQPVQTRVIHLRSK